jgi:hypothetical protein
MLRLRDEEHSLNDLNMNSKINDLIHDEDDHHDNSNPHHHHHHTHTHTHTIELIKSTSLNTDGKQTSYTQQTQANSSIYI